MVFVSSFFGVQAVAASALLTLPFQAGVALYFVSKHLAISLADLYRATVKSGVVTFCSTIGVLISTVMAEVGWIGPIAQLLLGSLFAAVGWILGLIVSKHPLLVQMRQAAKGMALVAPWLPVLGQWASGCRLGEKAS